MAIFFFQAEDGIRDGHVTGVQTCALPISEAEGSPLTVGEQVLLLAREKAQAATSRSEGGYVVLGGDSMLELDGEPIGKPQDRKSTRLNSSHVANSYAVFCLKKKS